VPVEHSDTVWSIVLKQLLELRKEGYMRNYEQDLEYYLPGGGETLLLHGDIEA
jgi:hypothetical protein